MQSEIDLPDRLLTAIQVRQFFGNVSHMWIRRRELTDPDFPAAIRIASRRYWKLSELRAWIDAHQRDAA